MSFIGRSRADNYVCFKCRTSQRGSAFTGERRCHRCGGSTVCIGYRVAVPKRTDDRGWEILAGEKSPLVGDESGYWRRRYKALSQAWRRVAATVAELGIEERLTPRKLRARGWKRYKRRRDDADDGET